MKLKILAIGMILLIICGTFLVTAKLSSKNSGNTGKEYYHSYNELTKLLRQLQQEYPYIFSYYSLGKTWENRDIWFVKISDNVSFDEDEPGVFYTGGQHGDEKQGYQVLIYSIKTIVENYTYVNVNQSFTDYVRNIVNNTQLFFMPMVNPDGVEARTRKNARPNDCPLGKTLLRGVDTNRNSGHKWELIDQYPIKYRFKFPHLEKINIKYPFFDRSAAIRGEGQYRGPHPFSEPESRAIKTVVENHSISISVDYHAAANEVYYGWAWSEDEPIERESLRLSIVQGVSNIGGYIVKKGMVPVLGSIRDWLNSQGILAFTIELPYTRGDRPLLHLVHQNGNPLPWKNIPILQVCETNVIVNLYLAERAIMLES